MAKRLSVIDVNHCVGCQACMFACVRRLGRGGLEGTCIHVRSAGGIRKGFVVIVCCAPTGLGTRPASPTACPGSFGAGLRGALCV